MIVRALTVNDRDAVQDILCASAVFTEEEIRVALLVLDEGLAGGLDGDYPLFAIEIDERVNGYACIGKTPLTASTWHLYWICIHPQHEGRGAGRMLQAHVEQFIRSRDGERIVLETSSQPAYERTRRFYLRAGYSEVGRINNFYKAGDDCMIFCKEL
jgi:ribosomal protein S18 acetylase RimI-like enzyme